MPGGAARCCASAALRFSRPAAGSELAPWRSLRHAEPDFPAVRCDTRRRRRHWGSCHAGASCPNRGANRRSCTGCVEAAEKRRTGRKKTRRMSERRERKRPQRVQRTPAKASTAGNPASAGLLPGMSPFADFCGHKSRSRKLAKRAAKPLFRFSGLNDG